MIRKQDLPVGLLVGALLLGACSPASPATPTESPTLAPPVASPTIEPATNLSLQQYSNPDFGYSLSYPAGYLLQSAVPHTATFLAPEGSSGHRERAWLTVELASEESPEWYANQVKEANANLGIGTTTSTQVLDGRQAYILGPLPGQDLNRQVFIVDNGILYHLTFVPDDPARGEEYQQMEALYAAILSSLRFQPGSRAVPPVTEISNMLHHLERALNARSEQHIARLLGDEFTLGNLSSTAPEAVSYASYGAGEVIPLILDEQLPPDPSLTLVYQVDWGGVPGSLDTYSGIFPGEVVTPLLARGWGLDGTGQAVLIIARRIDGSLFWRAAFTLE